MADPDKLYQDALNAISGVQAPDPESMKVALQQMVQQGTITPDQMQTALIDKNAFDNIASTPEYQQAQGQALAQLQEIGQDNGLTATDRAKIYDINSDTNTANKGRQDAIMQNARERGVGGSGLETANRLLAEQSAADTASRQGTDVAAQAEQRALSAIQGAGELGGQMQEAEFNRGAAKAGAQNAIDAANATMMNQGRQFNTSTVNNAKAQNLAEKQRISDTNTGIANTQETTNKSIPQQIYQDQLAKANATSGVLNNWAGQEAGQQQKKTGFQNQLIAGGLQAGGTALGTAFGGPVGGAVGSQAGSQVYGSLNPNAYQYENQLPGAFCGGTIEDMSKGGKVPGKATVSGDSPVNDTVLAKVSPGEEVIPRTTVDLVSQFHKHAKSKGPKSKEIDHEDIAKVFKALVSMKGGNK